MSSLIREGSQRGNMNEPPLTPKPLTVPKSQRAVGISSRSREQEIENIKRLLASISQRLDALK